MAQPVFSIIIPHYNIPELLVRCINSIPVREDIQVIVVDDCSPNADKYKETYPELLRPYLECYSTPLGGSAGRTRNVGIEHAKGKWLSFVDADDLLVENAEDTLFKYKDRPEDVLFFQSKSVMCDDITKPSGRNIFTYNFEHYFKTGNEQVLRLEFDVLWGKFVKKSLIDKYNIRFDEVRYCNDTYFSAAIGVYAEKIAAMNEITYLVTERAGSLTADKMKTIEEWEIRFHSTLHVQELLDAHNIKFRRYAFNDFMHIMWQRDKKRYFEEFAKLSLRHKMRVVYCAIRTLKAEFTSYYENESQCS